MNPKEIDYQLLARYMAGHCSADEQNKVEEWINADPENKEKEKQLRQIWQLSEQKEDRLQGFFDPENEWEGLQRRIQKEKTPTPPVERDLYAEKYRTSSIHSMSQRIIRVAAIFLVAGLIGIFSFHNQYEPEQKDEQIVLREVSTENAQRVNLTLGDGTKVMLNADSDIKFPEKFNAGIREVYLKGEAYFNVKRNPEKPFVIHSFGSVVRVLGTSFTVRSYEEENTVRVVVEEGKVAFGPEQSDLEEQVLLTANKMAHFTIDSKDLRTSEVKDMQLYLSWRRGYLKFRESPMEQVATALERRYGVEVMFRDPAIKNKKLTAFLKSRSIKNVLNVIAMSLDIEYELTEHRIIFG
ncbi:MAG: DUF4974 domain-containing protein [Balneolaceae bacterium]|nr:DUF4974 domain-containing protein [Balneolaceae bacterium]